VYKLSSSNKNSTLAIYGGFFKFENRLVIRQKKIMFVVGVNQNFFQNISHYR
jgi:hypothetical protein